MPEKIVKGWRRIPPPPAPPPEWEFVGGEDEPATTRAARAALADHVANLDDTFDGRDGPPRAMFRSRDGWYAYLVITANGPKSEHQAAPAVPGVVGSARAAVRLWRRQIDKFIKAEVPPGLVLYWRKRPMIVGHKVGDGPAFFNVYSRLVFAPPVDAKPRRSRRRKG